MSLRCPEAVTLMYHQLCLLFARCRQVAVTSGVEQSVMIVAVLIHVTLVAALMGVTLVTLVMHETVEAATLGPVWTLGTESESRFG